MDDFLVALPWRLAALAGLIVGSVSFLQAGVDFWAGLQRVGLSFLIFFVIGAAARALLALATPQNKMRTRAADGSAAAQPSEAAQA